MQVSKKILYLGFLISFLLLAPNTYASKRIALVVGNNAYQNVEKLRKAINDSNTISRTLSQSGFDVIQANDVNRRSLNKKIQEFVSSIESGDVAMFYFAGHGIEIEGQNYLLPTDIPAAEAGQEGFIRAESISLESVLGQLKAKKARLNIVVLDACRNNPFKREGNRSLGGTRGLAAVTPPKGTFILYSADAGEAALDTLGGGDNNPNSVFTRTLAPLISKPETTLVDLARKVRVSVKQLASTVQHEQTPAYYDSVLGDFYFTPRVNEKLAEKKETTTAKLEIKPSDSIELAYWNEVKDSENIDYLESYTKQFPDGNFVFLAKAIIAELNKQQPAVAAESIASAKKDNPSVERLDNCASHIEAKRLTSGIGGNAYDCYQAILREFPGNRAALAGIEDVENRYVEWVWAYIASANGPKAAINIEKLRKLNSDNENIPDLLAAYENLTGKVEVTQKNTKPASTVSKAKIQNKKSFFEDFNDNTYDWFVGEGKYSKGQIRNGFYSYKNKSSNTTRHSVKSLKSLGMQSLDLSRDSFAIEAKFTLVDYRNRGGYLGLEWGIGKSYKNKYFLGISPKGKFIFNYRQKSFLGYAKWSSSRGAVVPSKGLVKKTKATNKLRFEKRGDQFAVIINDIVVKTGDYKTYPTRQNVGFYVTSLTSVDIDYFKVEKL